MDGSVGESEGEFAVGSECDGPAVVVDPAVMCAAQRQQIVELGCPALTPPDDVVKVAAVVGDAAAGDRTATVQAA